MRYLILFQLVLLRLHAWRGTNAFRHNSHSRNPNTKKSSHFERLCSSRSSSSSLLASSSTCHSLSNFELFVLGLKTYKQHYRSILVPQSYKIPAQSTHFPIETWELELGSLVNKVRSKKVFIKNVPERELLLKELGFVWDVSRYKFEVLLEALFSYYHSHGDLLMPWDHVMSHHDHCPEHLCGYKIGDTYRRFLRGRLFADQNTSMLLSEYPAGFQEAFMTTKCPPLRTREGYVRRRRRTASQSSSLHLPSTSNGRLLSSSTAFKVLMQSLQCYKQLHGDVLLPLFYIVPSDQSVKWPSQIIGADLGGIAKGLHKEIERFSQAPIDTEVSKRISQLTELGFPLDKQSYDFLNVVKCLKVYKSAFGHLRVPQKFVIPEDDALPWPQHYKGKCLGSLVARIKMGKQFNSPSERDTLSELGLVFSPDAEFDRIVDALKAHYNLFGDYLVPRYFKVPDGDDAWPQSTWGLQLGNRVRNIRYYGRYNSAAHRDRLNAIGFNVTSTVM